MRIVILGCGFGGVYTARSLLSCKLFGSRPDIVLISRSPSFEFKPLFTEVLGGRLPPESVGFSLDSIFERNSCKIRIANITGIDAKKRAVETDSGDVRFDYLVISLGGSPESVPLTGGASLFSLESLDECIRLRDRISELAAQVKNVRGRKGNARNAIAIIGAGPTGVEAATEIQHVLSAAQDGRRTTARQPPIEISLIESATRILPDWGKKLRAQAESVLEESGIGVLTKTAVTRVGKDRIYLSARRSITTGTVIWCGGLRGLPVYESIGAPLDKKGRLRVNPYLHLPQYRNIFAMGDAINTEAFAMPVPRSGQAAYQQAKVIANNILSSESGKPLRRFTYSEVGEVMPVGGRRAIARILRVPLEGNPAWILEKAIFVMRVPGWSNKVKLLSGLALDPLVERGEEYLEKRGW